MSRALVIAVVIVGCGDGGGDPRCSIPGAGPGVDPTGEWCERLSSYRLFDDIATQVPAQDVVPYALNTPLFSDYAVKDRFVWLPPGTAMQWSDTDAFAMPPGAVVVKTFGYLADRRDPAPTWRSGDSLPGPGPTRRLLETRLLVRGESGWSGVSYVYPEADPDDATLAIAGAALETAWIHDDGSERTNSYNVPNKNQCKNCHAEHDDTIDLLGPKARHLNRDGQLEALVARGALIGAPSPAMWPRAPVASDPSSGSLDQRARAWLDINCSNCHNPRGAARTSGLYLDLAQTNPVDFGVCKPPVAAGRGSGGRSFGIVPGQPDASILVFRIESTEADIKMPELGRNLVDTEDVALIRAWITQLPGSCP